MLRSSCSWGGLCRQAFNHALDHFGGKPGFQARQPGSAVAPRRPSQTSATAFGRNGDRVILQPRPDFRDRHAWRCPAPPRPFALRAIRQTRKSHGRRSSAVITGARNSSRRVRRNVPQNRAAPQLDAERERNSPDTPIACQVYVRVFCASRPISAQAAAPCLDAIGGRSARNAVIGAAQATRSKTTASDHARNASSGACRLL